MSQSYAKDTSAMDTSAVDTSAVDTSIRRLVNHEIERTADRLIKVHGRRAFNHASMKVDVSRTKGDEADHNYWMKIAEKVKRQLPRYAGGQRQLARASA